MRASQNLLPPLYKMNGPLCLSGNKFFPLFTVPVFWGTAIRQAASAPCLATHPFREALYVESRNTKMLWSEENIYHPIKRIIKTVNISLTGQSLFARNATALSFPIWETFSQKNVPANKRIRLPWIPRSCCRCQPLEYCKTHLPPNPQTTNSGSDLYRSGLGVM